VGGVYKSTVCINGGILAELRKWGAEQKNSDGDGINIPEKYKLENIIYGPIKRGFVTLQGLYDGTVSIPMFFEALKLSIFEVWLEGVQQKDSVEYFE
jgi:hypothetical protein